MAGQYDAILFDLDGTLVAPEFAHVRSVFDEVGRQLDYRFSNEVARRLWHGLGGPRNEQVRELGLDVAEFWRVFDETEDPRDRAAAMRVFEDAALAAELSVPTALVTHCPPEPTEAVLAFHGLDEWFDAVVCCSDDLGWKPDPTPIEHALGEIGMAHLLDAADGDGRVAADGGTAPPTKTPGAQDELPGDPPDDPTIEAPGAQDELPGDPPSDPTIEAPGAPDEPPDDPMTEMPGAPAEPPSGGSAGALYVGDTAGDVGAAWNAGIDAVHVERFDHDRRQHCVLADYRVEAIDECAPLRALAGH